MVYDDSGTYRIYLTFECPSYEYEEIKFVIFTHRPNYVTRIQWQVRHM